MIDLYVVRNKGLPTDAISAYMTSQLRLMM